MVRLIAEELAERVTTYLVILFLLYIFAKTPAPALDGVQERLER